jgi:hypothetical protein
LASILPAGLKQKGKKGKKKGQAVKTAPLLGCKDYGRVNNQPKDESITATQMWHS